jgi:hypothetical protein
VQTHVCTPKVVPTGAQSSNGQPGRLHRRGYQVTGDYPVSVTRQQRYAKRTFKKFRERDSREMTIRMDRLRKPTELAAGRATALRCPASRGRKRRRTADARNHMTVGPPRRGPIVRPDARG